MPRGKSDDRWIRQCKGCGESFWQGRPTQLYCSKDCAYEHRDQWMSPKGGNHPRQDLKSRRCVVCEKEYQPVRVSQLACSKPCKQRLPSQLAWDKDVERRERRNDLSRAKFRAVGYPKQPNRSPKYSRKQTLTKAGWTVEQYDQRVAELDGKCYLCGATPDPNGVKAASRLHADHDHVTHLPRDLLCGRCNVGIGMFRDDPALLRAAAEYIERHRAAVAQSGQMPRPAGL